MKLFELLWFAYIIAVLTSDCLKYDSYFDVILYGDKKLCIPDFFQTELKEEAMKQFHKDFGFNLTSPVPGVLFLNCKINEQFSSFVTGGYSEQLKFSNFPSSNIKNSAHLWFLTVTAKHGVPLPNDSSKRITSKDLIAYGVMKHLNESNIEVLPPTIFWTPKAIPTDKKGSTAIAAEIKNEAFGSGIATGSLIHDVQPDKTNILMKRI
eukprot:gene1889-1030_t